MNAKSMTKVLEIDLIKYAAHEVCFGPHPRGPNKCIKCDQVFRPGEMWQRMKSPPDPEYGSYFIGVHCKCPARTA